MVRVSEYDERDPAAPGAPEADDAAAPRREADDATPRREDGEPSPEPSSTPVGRSDVEDTAPISYSEPGSEGSPAPETAPHEAPGRPGAPVGGPSYQPQDPYAWPTAPYPTGAYGQPYAPHPQHRQDPRPAGAVPAWLLPVVAGIALMVGLLGGTLGGVAVSRSMGGGGSVDIPVIESEQSTVPLEADNGSIAAVAARLLPSTVQVLAGGGSDGESGGGATGSGFVLDRKGHVITNNHVVADATGAGEITVVDHAGKEHDATIVGRSPVYDIAVLEVEGTSDLKPAALGSSRSMRVGESVVAIGSPLGLSSTVTSGIVSALDRPVTTGTTADDSSYINAVQTDAAINPGNSGGPLVNMRGQVVGVNSAIATTGGILGGEAGNIGVGFAIPMEQVRVTAGQILATGEARYPVIGASVETGTQGNGAEVVGVPVGTPADRAGLEKGDVVVAVDDKPVTDGIGLIVAIRSHQPGETITLTVRRDGAEKRVEITLDAKVG